MRIANITVPGTGHIFAYYAAATFQLTAPLGGGDVTASGMLWGWPTG